MFGAVGGKGKGSHVERERVGGRAITTEPVTSSASLAAGLGLAQRCPARRATVTRRSTAALDAVAPGHGSSSWPGHANLIRVKNLPEPGDLTRLGGSGVMGFAMGAGRQQRSVEAIGPYEVLDVLGRGGMGIVYRARRAGSDRVVALKTVQVPAPHWVAGIRREIQALSRIRHPGVVRMLEFGVQDALPWYAMDLLEGETLRRFFQRIWSPYRPPVVLPPEALPCRTTEDARGARHDSSVPRESHTRPIQVRPPASGTSDERRPPAAAGQLPTVLEILHQLCSTLAFLHGEGVVNCDLKPENVLLVEGRPVLIDFGLMAHAPKANREVLDSHQGFAGTVSYMSPEQVLGGFADARSDLYSIGCILYELVVGRPPFEGAVLLAKQSGEAPRPPSDIVDGVPPELERIIRRLLERDLDRRFGFADEVATELANLAGTEPHVRGFPKPAPYLYRPRFVGRDSVMAEFDQARTRLLDGTGGLFVLGGESGVGKTRLAMEMTRTLPSQPVRVITSESSSAPIERRGSGAAPPFGILRPILEAVADQCHEGGWPVTERLLGSARLVLAPYEPRLTSVPVRTPDPAPIPLSAEAARKRLFQSAGRLLAEFSREVPLLWVIDDLGWADELSVSFLASLRAEYFEHTAVLIVCTYRTEDSGALVQSLIESGDVWHTHLERLDSVAVRSMVGDMLALSEPADDLVEYVTREAEGIPFFVSEYLRAAVDAQLIYRDADHVWRIAGDALKRRHALESLGLPKTLRELIAKRFEYLKPASRELSLVASVLGRESDADLVRSVSGLSEEAASDALSELLWRHIFVQTSPERLRFAHDKLHEVAYQQLDAARRKALHGRAARELESRLTGDTDAWRVWPVLGHHHAEAEHHARAARYLRMAADHARETHANHGAIQLYREAIEQLVRLIAESPATPDVEADLDTMREALGDVLTLTGQREQARLAYETVLQRNAPSRLTSPAPSGAESTSASPVSNVQRARILLKLGKTWEMEHRHEEALHFYASARETSGGESPSSAHPDLRHEWLQAQLQELWVLYWLARVEEMDRLVGRLEPLVSDFGSSVQHARFYQVLLLAGLRRHRFVIDEEMLRHARAAVSAARDPIAQVELPMSQFLLAFALLLNGSGAAVEPELQRARELAEEAGDASLLTRCWTYLTVNARLEGDIERTRSRAEEALRVAQSAGLKEYVAAAYANQAWVHYRQNAPDAARRLASDALALWASLNLVFPFQFLALVPLFRLELEGARLEPAARYAQALLSPTQWVLSGAATDALSRGCSAWERNDARCARREFEQASQHLRLL